MSSIVVLLNNKLVTCDTIVPFAMELKARHPGAGIDFICFERRTADAIRSNIVLWDAIRKIGNFSFWGRDEAGMINLIRHRIVSAARLLLLALRLASGRTCIIHFKALNVWPLRVLALLAKGRVCFAQGAALGVGKLEQAVTEAMAPRQLSRRVPAADFLLAFNPGWPVLSDPRLSSRARAILPPPFTYGTWMGHVREAADRYFAQVFGAAGQPDRPAIVTVILSSMDENGLLSRPDLFPALFEETLDALQAVGCTDPVLIKLHPATLPRYRDLIAAAIRGRPRLNLLLCDLHPAVLAQRSRFVVANCYSTTFAVFCHYGLPTIEYTSYRPEILAITAGGSMRPELVESFINRDPGRLRQVFAERLARAPAGGARSIEPEFGRELYRTLGLAAS